MMKNVALLTKLSVFVMAGSQSCLSSSNSLSHENKCSAHEVWYLSRTMKPWKPLSHVACGTSTTISCTQPRGMRLFSRHHGGHRYDMVSRGLRGSSIRPVIMPRGVSISEAVNLKKSCWIFS